jgi:HlyD family secretion protein
MKSFRSAPASPDTTPENVIRVFQSETSEILAAPEPRRVRATLLVLTAMVVSLLGTATFTRLDRVVASKGQIVTTEPTIVLQALDASIIKTLDVHEGQRVKAGQVLATLDPTFAAADVSALNLQLASLNAQIARCEAELAQKPFDPPANPDPAVARYDELQKAYYLQRKAQFDAQMHSYDEQMAQTKATIAKLQNDQVRYGDRAKLAKEVEDMRATLAAAQVGSRLNLLSATDQKVELLRNLEFEKNALVESQHQLESTTSTRDAFREQWLGQASQELVTARNQRDAALQQLEKATKHRDLVRLEAPDDAVVLKVAKLSVGSVLKEGDPLYYLAPLRSPMEAEVRIEARDVGFIRPGDPVKVKFDAFNFIEHGMAEGKLRWVSEGAFTTNDDGLQPTVQQTGQPTEPYYKGRVELDNVELRNVPDGFRLIPGMTLTGDVHIGTRSLLMYVVTGALQGMGEAMREP